MTFKAEISVDDDILAAYKDAAGKLPKLTQTAFRRQAQRIARRVRAELRTEPPPPTYPLQWKSQRQRRYVLAKLRREGNLPYQRTGRLLRGWEVSYNTDNFGGLLEVENDTSYARYVQGDDAQPMHLATGWTQAAEVVAKYREEAEDALIETFFTVVDGIS